MSGRNRRRFAPTRESKCGYCSATIDPVMSCELPRNPEVEPSPVNEDGKFCTTVCHRLFLERVKPLGEIERAVELQEAARRRESLEYPYHGGEPTPFVRSVIATLARIHSEFAARELVA